MRSLTLRLFVSFLVVVAAPVLFAHDITITGTQTFASLDGSSSDHDGVANGVFTVNDGNLIVNGIVNCNDDSTVSACSMAFVVSGNVTINSGGALYAENRSGSGTGGAIALTAGGNLALNGTAIVSTSSKSSSGSTGGAISATVMGSVALAAGTTIDSGAANARGGAITIAAGNVVSIDGNVLSGPSRTILSTRLTGVALDGGTANQIGGQIAISSSTFVEPAMLIGSTANVISQGDNDGAGPVRLDACGIQIRGLVAALSRKDSAAKVAIRSGKDVLVDGRDLGATGTRMGRVRADAPTGTAANKGVDIFAGETIDIFGPSGSLYAITSMPGLHDSKSYGGLIRILSLGDVVNASGNVIDDGHSASGDTGGTVEISAKGNANLNTAVIRAIGDFSTGNPNRGGGRISVRSYSGNVVWTNGLGEVRPVGSTSGLTPADQGAIVLTACGTINTTGTTFPVMGTPTSPLPETHAGVCTPAAPSLPVGVPPLVTCNTPPVANDAAATTNEDTTVTITLSGTDADGDSLTFTIVSGPLHGSLGPIVPTGPTSATVNYTPALNYNGSDSFVYRANDGNGGTDDATVTITIAPVNDPPTFLVGPTDVVLEDSGARTYANWITAISPGPSDESAQTVTFTVTNDNNALFSVQPSVAPNGTLTYTPAPNAYGSATITVVAHDNGGTANGGNDTSAAQTSSINVTAVNDEPSFVAGGNQTVNEDAGAQTVSGWATSINAGPNEGSQTVAFVTSNNNNALFSVQPSVAPNGTLTYTPAANANGSATVTVYLTDNGGTANGGDDTSPSQTFTITVNAVNDAPSFTSGGDVTVLEDSGAYSAAWATGISAGPADESGQTVAFSTSNDNNALFTAQPSISASGVLTFTLAANAYGSATVTVSLSDNGGTANGGVGTSASQTFVLNVTPVNDEPSFTSGGNVTVNEDSGAYSAAWATGVSAGPNEGSQTVAFVTSNDNNALFAVQPSVSPSGVLTFTPAADAFGTATVTVYLTDNGGTANGGDDTSASQTFILAVNAVNDAPSFTGGGNVNVNEDSGAYSAAWATGISAGPANESSQTVSFVVTNSNNALFSVQPTVSSSGVLSFTPASNTTGSATVTIYAQDNGGTANGGIDVSASQTFTITVSDVNDAPTFTPGANQSSLEDAGPQTVPNWATSISAGPPNESGQTVTFFVSNDNNALFSAQPSISPAGTLTYTAAPNANGSAIVTVYAQDNGGTANGGSDTSATYTFTISIVAVNDAPSFTGGGDVTVLEDSGSYSANWATGMSAGPADESGQTLTFNVISNSNPSLFSSGPSISAGGVLSFTPVANAFGSATITINLQDNGGTAGGGVDTSASYVFTINVSPVNDAPSFTPGGDVTVNEDAGPYSASWATGISAGPANESGQSVAFLVSNNNNALFLVQPSISPSGILTFTTALNAFGSATVTVSLQDNGGTANGGVDTSAAVVFTITVNAVNDAPTAATDTWDTLGNTELRVDLPGGLTPKIADTTPSSNGVRDNDSDPEGDPSVVTGIVGCADPTAPFDCTLGDGSKVSMLANGSFTYTPGPGITSGSFQYTVTDIPAFGSPASATGTVNINILDMIWYVNGSAAPGGNGTSIAPFTSFSSLNGPGGSGDVDGAGSTIFVHDSNVIGGIGLEANQKLWGEGVGLSTANNLNGNGSPQVLVAPGVRARIFGGAGDAVSVAGVTGVDVAGLDLNSTGSNGIDVTSNPFGPATGVSIHDNVVTGAALEGIDVNAGSVSGTTVAVNNTSIVSAGNGFDVSSVGSTVVSYTNGTILSTGGSGIRMSGSGNLTVSGLSNVTVDGSTASDGVNIANATFDAVAGGAFNTVNGGTISVGTSGNPVGGAAFVLSSVSGDLAITSLNAFAGTGQGVSVDGSGLFTGSAGMRVAVGGGSINAPSARGLNVSNATIASTGINFTRIVSAGALNGIVLNNTGTSGGLTVSGTGAASSGGSVTNATGDAILLSSTKSVSLTDFDVTNSAQSHIDATNVDGLTLTRVHTDLSTDHGILGSTVRNLVITGGLYDRGGAGAAVPNKHGVFITNLLGTSSVTGATFRRSNTIQFRVQNSAATNAYPGAPDVLTVSNTTWDQHTGPFAGDHLSVDANTGGNFSLAVNSSSGINSFTTGGVAVQATGSGSGHVDVSVTGALVNGTTAAVVVGTSGTSSGTYSIVGNKTANGTGFSNVGALAISVVNTSTGSLNGTIDDNTITNAPSGNGIQVILQGNGSASSTITKNVVSGNVANSGIRAQAMSGSGFLSLKVHDNNVNLTGPFSLDAISIESGGSGSGHTNTICLNMSNNVSSSPTSGEQGYRLRQRTGTTFNLQNFVGSGASATDVTNWINVTKTNVGTTDIVIATAFSAAPGNCP